MFLIIDCSLSVTVTVCSVNFRGRQKNWCLMRPISPAIFL